MSSLQVKNALLDKVQKLNRILEKSYLELAVALVEVVETEAYKEAGYDEFSMYYRDELNREKSTISRLLTVGEWLIKYKLLKEANGASYAKLAVSISAYPDKPTEYILAAAKTNTLSELLQSNRERVNGPCIEHKPIQICSECRTRIYA